MRFRKVIMVLVLGMLFATSAWAQPSNWAVRVPTHAQYTGSGSADFYSYYVNHNFSCSLWNKAGIDHFTWTCCCGGNPGFLDPAISPYTYFDFYDIRGDYYDCDGNLLASNLPISSGWGVVQGTGTVLSGGIGGQGTYPLCILSSIDSASPASECRVYVNMSIQKRSPTYCSTWPEISVRKPEENAGVPPNGVCPFVKNPVNVATGNKYEEILDLSISTPGLPLEIRRSYNSQVSFRWSHGLWMDSQL